MDLAADAPPSGGAAAYAQESGPIFHHLFGTERVTPVSSVVSELWTPKGARPARDIEASAARVATAHADAAKPNAAPLRLFEFLRPELRNRSNGTG
jgi:hypothetical protein